MVGTSNLQENSITIDDSTSGNGNGVINSNECVNLDIALKNNGCANATGISATLTTNTPGVTVTQGSSNYPDMCRTRSSIAPQIRNDGPISTK